MFPIKSAFNFEKNISILNYLQKLILFFVYNFFLAFYGNPFYIVSIKFDKALDSKRGKDIKGIGGHDDIVRGRGCKGD